MKREKETFIQILRIELEDLREDINLLIEHCGEVWHKHMITEIGYCGNLAVLKSELRGVGLFNRILDELDPASYESLDAMTEDLENKLIAEIKKYGMVPAVDTVIRRKIDKVKQYVEQ